MNKVDEAKLVLAEFLAWMVRTGEQMGSKPDDRWIDEYASIWGIQIAKLAKEELKKHER